jgi:hydrogenase nickel incorporation protein HypA/HybF
MHELSIASAVLAIVERHADGRRVERVELRVGHLRQVVPSALEFAWQLVAEDTVAAGAQLVMEEVPATVRCERCASESALVEFPARCASCGSLDCEVTGGEELHVEALELDDEVALTGG